MSEVDNLDSDEDRMTILRSDDHLKTGILMTPNGSISIVRDRLYMAGEGQTTTLFDDEVRALYEFLDEQLEDDE